ncbi:MAG: hypothetical protein AB7O94_02515 [Hyphomicrobiaceae bacterium]
MHVAQAFTAAPTANAGLASTSDRHSSQTTRRSRIFGLLLVATVPALFWTAMVALVGPLAGYAPSPAVLAAIAVGIGGFLFAVCGALTSSAR